MTMPIRNLLPLLSGLAFYGLNTFVAGLVGSLLFSSTHSEFPKIVHIVAFGALGRLSLDYSTLLELLGI